jgi:acetyltransferase-like isoleucine patch superfamily enzyme
MFGILYANAELVLEANVGISGCVLCAAKSIHIGEGVNIGSGALLIDTDFHQPIDRWEWGNDPGRGARPIHIGRGAFIGARAIVLKGVTIGERAVVGAGAVVTKDVPSGHIAVGNPACILLPRAENDRRPAGP